MPISRRYIRTGSFVLSSAPGVRSRSISSPPSPCELVVAVALLRIDDFDARAPERAEQIVQLLRRGDVRREQLVHLVIEEVALLLAEGDELLEFRRTFLQWTMPCSSGDAQTFLCLQIFEAAQQLFLRAPERGQFPVGTSPRAVQPLNLSWTAAISRSYRCRFRVATQSAEGAGAASGREQRARTAHALLHLDAREARSGTWSAATSARLAAISVLAQTSDPSRSGSSSCATAASPSTGWWASAHSSPASAGLSRTDAGTATAGASVLRWAAARRISSRTTPSVMRALCANRSANWSRAAASGMVRGHRQHLVQERPAAVRPGEVELWPRPGRAGSPGTGENR